MKPLLNEQLTRSLLVELASGFYGDGQRFLSNRKICRLWGVSETTAKASLATLVGEGLLLAVPRSGYRLAQGARGNALLLLHKRSVPHLPPPERWESKRYGLRGARAIRRIAAVIDGVSDAKPLAYRDVPPVASSGLLCARAFFDAAVRADFEILLYLNDGAPDSPASLVQTLLAAQPEGVAIFRRTSSRSLCPLTIPLLAANIPVVSVFDDCRETPAISININNVGTGYEAGQHLLRLGHRRFAFIMTLPEADMARERLEGFRKALEEAGAPTSLQVLEVPRHGPVSAVQAAALRQAFAGAHERPTAVFSPVVAGMAQLEQVLVEAGCRVPEDVSILVCASSALLSKETFPYDLMDIDFAAISQAAFLLLTSIMSGMPVDRGQLFTPSYCPRGSVAPPPPATSGAGDDPAPGHHLTAARRRAKLPRQPRAGPQEPRPGRTPLPGE
jgi:DNA-binding LacI/PurR family transcriptional regulator